MTLNDDPKELYSQFEPVIATAPNGRFEIVWFDMRAGPGRFVTDVYVTRSSDAGTTWSKDVRATDQSIKRLIGMWKPGFGGGVRQPPGIAMADALTVLGWDDTRNGHATTETQDVYVATEQYKALARTGGLPRGAGSSSRPGSAPS